MIGKLKITQQRDGKPSDPFHRSTCSISFFKFLERDNGSTDTGEERTSPKRFCRYPELVEQMEREIFERPPVLLKTKLYRWIFSCVGARRPISGHAQRLTPTSSLGTDNFRGSGRVRGCYRTTLGANSTALENGTVYFRFGSCSNRVIRDWALGQLNKLCACFWRVFLEAFQKWEAQHG